MPATEDEKDLTTEEATSTEEPSTATGNNNNSADESPTSGKDWEKSYKGLQSASTKKQEELQAKIDNLEETINSLTEQVETQKTDKDVLANQLIKAKEDLKETQEGLETVNKEKAKLDAKVERSDLIAKKYPNLSPLKDFIPEGSNLEEFEQNAETFKEALGVYTNNFVAETVEGASPVPPERTSEEFSETEEDRLWSVIVQTSGISGKETEYNDAYEKWLKIQRAKQNN